MEFPSIETLVVGVALPTILATWVVVYQNRTRTQRDFFIKEIDTLKDEYRVFINNIRSSQESAESIRDGFKSFSIRIKLLLDILHDEYYLKNVDLFALHGKLQVRVTDFKSIEDQYNQPVVNLTSAEKTEMETLFLSLHRSFILLIVKVNKTRYKHSWMNFLGK